MADNKWTSRFFRDPGDEGVPPDQEAGGEDEAATEAVERGTAEVAREPETLERATADEPETLEPAPAGTEQLETLEQVPGEAPTEEVVAPPVEVEPHRVFAGTGISWAFIVGTLITVAIIVLAVQNTDRVPVTLYFWDLEAPLIIVMLVTALAAIVVDELIGMILRRRRRRVLADREELKRLRARTGGRIE